MGPEMISIVPTLRSDLHLTVQDGKSDCYVLEDPIRQKFYRIGRPEYVFLTKLDGKMSLAEAIQSTNQLFDEEIFDENNVKATLQWLMQNQLLQDSSDELVAGRLKVDESMRRQKFLARLNLITIKIPLFNPDPFFEKISPYLRWLTGPVFAIFWIVTIVCGGVVLYHQAGQFFKSATAALAPGNVFFLWLSWFILKILHEFSHALTCYRYHGRVYEAGILFIVFFPLTYVNASSTWNFPGRWQRIHAAFAGIYAEFFVAAIAVIVWAGNPNSIVGSIAHNLVLVAGFSSLLFNINPLMRFDGYFILSDLVGIPNLYGRGREFMASVFGGLFFGKWSYIRRFSRWQEFFIGCYGGAAWVWRILVMTFLLLLVAKALHGMGIFIAIISLVLIVGMPVLRLKNKLTALRLENPPAFRRFWYVCGICGVVLGLLPHVLHWQKEVKTSAVVQYEDEVLVKSKVAGFLQTLYVRSGDTVVAGQPLVDLNNPDLVAEAEQLELQLQQQMLKKRNAIITDDVIAYQVLEEQSSVLKKKLAAAREDLADLHIIAETDGTIIGYHLEELQDTYVKKGREILSIVSEDRKKILASVDQEGISAFRRLMGKSVEVIKSSMNRSSFSGTVVHVSPKAEARVPDNGLSAAYGGPIAVHQSQNARPAGGTADFEFFLPRFSVEIDVPPVEAGNLLVGQLVTVRFRGQSVSLWMVIKSQVLRYFSYRLGKSPS